MKKKKKSNKSLFSPPPSSSGGKTSRWETVMGVTSWAAPPHSCIRSLLLSLSLSLSLFRLTAFFNKYIETGKKMFFPSLSPPPPSLILLVDVISCTVVDGWRSVLCYNRDIQALDLVFNDFIFSWNLPRSLSRFAKLTKRVVRLPLM